MKRLKDYILNNFVRVLIILAIIWLLATLFSFVYSLKYERKLYQGEKNIYLQSQNANSGRATNATNEAIKITKIFSSFIATFIFLILLFIIIS